MGPIIPISGCGSFETQLFFAKFRSADALFANLSRSAGNVTEPITLPRLGYCDLEESREHVDRQVRRRLRGRDRAYLVGYSTGGLLGVSMMVDDPELVGSVCGVAATLGDGTPSMERYFGMSGVYMQIMYGTDLRGYDQSLRPFQDETARKFSDRSAELAGRLVHIGSKVDKIVPPSSSLDPRYEIEEQNRHSLEADLRISHETIMIRDETVSIIVDHASSWAEAA
jgi:hypothetical protein